MIKNKLKFIYLVIFIIISIIFIWVFSAIFFRSVDRSSYLELVIWEWIINWKNLDLWKRVKLVKNDIIETKTKDSLAVIEWWDWSITRIWWNTKLKIEEEFISKDKNNINILFSLDSWKTWSNVISYLWEESYFKQKFNTSEASVRWTIFTVDLEKNYVAVENHKIKIIDEEHWEFEIKQNKQLNLLDFKFISFEDFIKFFKDKWFFEINKKLDKEYLLKLSKIIEKNIGEFIDFSKKEIDNLTWEQREKIYKLFLEKYQELNFASLEISPKLFDLKIKLKENLISLAPNTEKESILKTLSYDLEDIFKNKNFESFDWIINILNKNKDFLNIDILKEYFNSFNIKFDFWKSIDDLVNTFNEKVINNPDYKIFFEKIKNSVSESIENQKGAIFEILDYIKNFFLKILDFIKNLFS